jgi:hypothetical protein
MFETLTKNFTKYVCQNDTFTTGNASYISNIVIDDFVFRPTNENLTIKV